MTETLSATSTAFAATHSSATPPQRGTRTLLGCGIAAGPLFLGAGIAQGLARDGFDLTRNAISQLSLGDTAGSRP